MNRTVHIALTIFSFFGSSLKAQTVNNIDTKSLRTNYELNKSLTAILSGDSKLYDTTLFIYDLNYDGWKKIILKETNSYKGLIIRIKGDSVIKKETNVQSIFTMIENKQFSKSLYKKQQKKAKSLDSKIRVWLNPLDYAHSTFIIFQFKEYELELDPWRNFEVDKNEEELFYETSKY